MLDASMSEVVAGHPRHQHRAHVRTPAFAVRKVSKILADKNASTCTCKTMTNTTELLRYVRLPNISLKQMLRLAKTLLRDKPMQATMAIEAAAGDLEAHVTRVEQALTLRMVATNAEVIASEVDFDRAVDGLWLWLRRQLEAYVIYEHPGLAALSKAQRLEAGLDALASDAARARALRDRLFGPEGTNFTTMPYAEQAETMATILRLIEHEGLLAELEALVGDSLPRLLRVCQRQYEHMVSDRLTRAQGTSEDLRTMRQQLRWLIVQYNTAVYGLAKYEDPSSFDVVERAVVRIRPVQTTTAETDEAELDEDGAFEEPSPDEASELVGNAEAIATAP
jgi:hypothetical protein